MNQYAKRNISAKKFFRYNHQKYKNRKPDGKPDSGPKYEFACIEIFPKLDPGKNTETFDS